MYYQMICFLWHDYSNKIKHFMINYYLVSVMCAQCDFHTYLPAFLSFFFFVYSLPYFYAISKRSLPQHDTISAVTPCCKCHLFFSPPPSSVIHLPLFPNLYFPPSTFHITLSSLLLFTNFGLSLSTVWLQCVCRMVYLLSSTSSGTEKRSGRGDFSHTIALTS